MPIEEINRYIQGKLAKENLERIGAVEAAEWLSSAGLLSDSQQRPGLPLRKLLRQGLIKSAEQQANRRWFIYRQS